MLRLLLAMLIVASSPALSQEHDHHRADHWYDLDCCSLEDCAPINSRQSVAIVEGGVRVISKDHGIDQIVPFGDERLRASLDSEWHICIIGTSAQPDFTYESNILRCVYMPGMA